MRATSLGERNAFLFSILVVFGLLSGCADKPPVSEATRARVRSYEQTKPSDTSPEARLRGYNQAHGASSSSSGPQP